MKAKKHILFLFILIQIQFCKAQQIQTALPKVENYDKGELEIKVGTFSSENPISIGKIIADGTIQFNFPKIDLNAMEETHFFSMQKIGRALGMFVCHDKGIVVKTETVEAIEVKNIFLYKYGQQVGALIPATQKEMLEDEFVIGNTISWFYSNGDAEFIANCTTYEDDETAKDGLDRNTIRNNTSYNISFKKGWNIVSHRLLKKKDITKGTQRYSRRLIEQKTSIAKIPHKIKWYLKYWANDELLEIEHQLVMLKPITKQNYERWLPKKIGNLKRTDYEVGKILERMPTTNNVNLLFEKGSKKIDLTIVDCADNKDAAGVYTLMKDMASRDWKDKTETGYRSASKMDGKRVMIDYNEKEVKTVVSYNENGRFLIKAEAIDITPEALWEILKDLNIKDLE